MSNNRLCNIKRKGQIKKQRMSPPGQASASKHRMARGFQNVFFLQLHPDWQISGQASSEPTWSQVCKHGLQPEK